MAVLPSTDLKISDVQSAIGATTGNLSELCTHPNINMWSEEKPGHLEANLSLNQIEYIRPTGGAGDPYSLMDFAGYDHSTVAPSVSASDIEFNSGTTSSGNQQFSALYNMYNVDLSQYVQNYNQAMVRIYDGTNNFIRYEYTPLNAGTTSVSFTLSYSGETNYIIKYAFGDGSAMSWVFMPGDYIQNVHIYQPSPAPTPNIVGIIKEGTDPVSFRVVFETPLDPNDYKIDAAVRESGLGSPEWTGSNFTYTTLGGAPTRQASITTTLSGKAGADLVFEIRIAGDGTNYTDSAYTGHFVADW